MSDSKIVNTIKIKRSTTLGTLQVGSSVVIIILSFCKRCSRIRIAVVILHVLFVRRNRGAVAVVGLSLVVRVADEDFLEGHFFGGNPAVLFGLVAEKVLLPLEPLPAAGITALVHGPGDDVRIRRIASGMTELGAERATDVRPLEFRRLLLMSGFVVLLVVSTSGE